MVSERNLRVLKELYKEGTCRVRFGEIETDWLWGRGGTKTRVFTIPGAFHTLSGRARREVSKKRTWGQSWGCGSTRVVFCRQHRRHGTRGGRFNGVVENGWEIWEGMENAV